MKIMMRNLKHHLLTALFALSVISIPLISAPSLAWAEQAPPDNGTNVVKLAWQQPVHWVSVAQIKHSLDGQPPMAVGFDIDDTVLFSSPGFWRGQQMFSPGSQDYLSNPKFYEKMNNGWDAFSLPKQSGADLIAMHLQRGDKIYFITAREKSPTETVSQTLQQLFHIPDANMNPVIFAGSSPKVNSKIKWIKQEHIKIYYGDSDGDITAARAAGARGIRVLRAANSTYQPLPEAGAFGEEVLINSQY